VPRLVLEGWLLRDLAAGSRRKRSGRARCRSCTCVLALRTITLRNANTARVKALLCRCGRLPLVARGWLSYAKMIRCGTQNILDLDSQWLPSSGASVSGTLWASSEAFEGKAASLQTIRKGNQISPLRLSCRYSLCRFSGLRCATLNPPLSLFHSKALDLPTNYCGTIHPMAASVPSAFERF